MSRRSEAVMGDGQVEDQAPAARCVVQVISDLHVAVPFACVAWGVVCWKTWDGDDDDKWILFTERQRANS